MSKLSGKIDVLLKQRNECIQTEELEYTKFERVRESLNRTKYKYERTENLKK